MRAAQVVVGAVALALLACVRQSDANTTIDTTAAAVPAPVSPPDSASIRAATATLAAFLDASREGSPTRDGLPNLTCPADTPVSGPMLAAFRLLPVSTRGDTVVGRAVVTTVADQDIDRIHPGYFVARLRVRSDTLEWDVLRDQSGRWLVCNGIQFGLTAPDSLTAWRPNGASAAAARSVADSIARSTSSER